MMPTPHTAIAVPRSRSGKISHMMAWAIGMTGPPPNPWSMRMATRNSRVGAMPERNELAVNRTVQIRKNRRRPKRAESQPVAGITTALAARYDVMTHDISSSPAENEPCMWGSATLVTLVSRTCRTVTIITLNVMAQRRADEIDSASGARDEEGVAIREAILTEDIASPTGRPPADHTPKMRPPAARAPAAARHRR